MRKLKGLSTAVAIAGLCVGASIRVDAALEFIDISGNLQLNNVGVVGIAAGVTGLGQGTPVYEAMVAQHLLDMGPGETEPITGVWEYKTSTPTDDYTGTIISYRPATLDRQELGYYVASGAQYAIAKYDGENAGYVLFFLGGSDAYLPADSATIWVNNQGNGYGLSNITLFNGDDSFTPVVPEPATVLAGALLLLPFGASAIRIIRKKG